MSSHHIVKEDQEPALIIADVNSVSPSLLNQLLEWNPIVMVSGESLSPVIQLGIKVDVLVVDEPKDLPQDHIRILPQITTFLDTALTYLVNRKCHAVNILSNDAAPDLLLRYADHLHAVLLGNGKRICTVGPTFRKWKMGGERIYLYGDAAAETKGLVPISQNEYMTEADGFYSIHFHKQWGLVGEQLS